MTKSKTTKRALMLSVLSMLLCVAMLTGSTFAWFTDSVVSGNNKIVAGNLDVELYHSKNDDLGDKVSPDTMLFTDRNGDPIKWEPGVMVYENFTVKNVGSLALKFNMTVNASAFNTTTDGKSLKDVLKVAIRENEVFTGTREEALALTYAPFDGFSVKDVELKAGENKTYAIVIYWEPTDHDNDYNLNNERKDDERLYIDLGVTLVATQAAVESDSFDKDYDKNAVYPAVPNPIDVKVEGTIGGGTETKLTDTASGTSITIPANAATENTAATFSMKLTDSASDSATYEISLTDADGNKVELTSAATVTANIGKGLKNVEVYHNNVLMDKSEYSYDSAEGILTITTTSFSPFKVTFEQDVAASVNGVAYSSFDEALEAAKNGDTVVLCEDVSTSSPINLTKNVTIELNNKTLTYTGTASWFIKDDAQLTINNGTLEANNIPSPGNRGVICSQAGSSVTLNDVTFNTTGAALYPRGDAAVVNVNRSTINGGAYAIATNANSAENYNVVINVVDSTLTTKNSTVLVNIPCQLTMTNTTVNGAFHGVIVRGGTATLTDCTIYNAVDPDDKYLHYFDNEKWGTGNTLTLGALVFGNKDDTEYQYPTYVTLVNTKVTSGSQHPAIYGIGNTGEGLGATLICENCVIEGDKITGNEYATIVGVDEGEVEDPFA